MALARHRRRDSRGRDDDGFTASWLQEGQRGRVTAGPGAGCLFCGTGRTLSDLPAYVSTWRVFMHIRVITAFPVLLLLAISGCATAGATQGGDLRSLNLSEIQESSATNALELVEQLRPRWLQSRGPRSFGSLSQDILVYVNDARAGTVQEVLRTISKVSIRQMRWVDSSEAARLPGAGSGHVEAAILIYTHDWER